MIAPRHRGYLKIRQLNNLNINTTTLMTCVVFYFGMLDARIRALSVRAYRMCIMLELLVVLLSAASSPRKGIRGIAFVRLEPHKQGEYAGVPVKRNPGPFRISKTHRDLLD